MKVIAKKNCQKIFLKKLKICPFVCPHGYLQNRWFNDPEIFSVDFFRTKYVLRTKFQDHWPSGSGDIRANRQTDKFSKFLVFVNFFFDNFFRDLFQNSYQTLFFRQIAALLVNVNKVRVLRQI